MWMNQYEVEDMISRYGTHPVLGPAVMTLGSLMAWTNGNSDGWSYWPKPSRAADKLMDLIAQHDRFERQSALHLPHAEATPVAVAAALRPIKAFRTRQGADFEIFTSVADIRAAVERRRAAIEAAERAELARLQEKYAHG